MKEILIGVFIFVLALTLLTGLGWLVQGNQFFMFKFFAPKYEEVRREVFEESKAYQHGTIQELDKMRLEHVRSRDGDIKHVIEQRALRMTAEFDKSNLPVDIRQWIYSIEDNR